MSFAEQLQKFVKKITGFKDSITTEEATKTSVILPFFQLLGYDVFDPTTFVPEFVADVGIKRGEKVDYAILQEGKPVIIIEAKSINRNLEKHDSQLFRYFSTTEAKFAILTNGIRYRFYTDLDNQNKMDAIPFLDFDLLHLRETQIEELQKFHKDSFNVAQIAESASDLKYKDSVKQLLAAQWERPSDEFVRFILKDLYQGTKTQNVVERFRPLIKDSLDEFVSELMNDKIKTALSVSPPAPAAESAPVSPQPEPEPLTLSTLEQNAYAELKRVLKDYVNLNDISYKKTESYVAILYQNNVRKWICRLILTDTQTIIILPDAEKKEIRRSMAHIYELRNYTYYLASVIARYGTLMQELECANPPLLQAHVCRRFPKYTHILPDGSYVLPSARK